MDWFLGSGAAVALPFWKTLAQLAFVTILPILCGMALRHARPTLALRLERPANIFALVFLALIIAAAVAREKDLAHQFAVAGPAAITLGLLESTRIAMPAVVYSLFMFLIEKGVSQKFLTD